MNTDISIRPAYLDRLAPPDAFAEAIGFVRPPRVSMNNDRFNVLDEDGSPVLPPSLELKVILLWENDTRIYRAKNADGSSTYDADTPLPPDCYSDNRITPSEGAVQPQHPTCAGCPRAIRDEPSQKGTTLVSACKDQYKVACLVADAGGKVFLLTIGPKSRKPYAVYRNLLKQHHASGEEVITKLDYADKAFGFSFYGWITPPVAEQVKKVYETDEPAMVVNAFDKPRQTALLPPKAQEWGDKVVISPKDVPAVQAAVQHFDDKRTADLAEAQFVPEVGEPPKRRGRPPKEAPQAEPFGQAPVASAAPSTPQQSSPAPRGNGGGFGMEAAQAPPDNIQEALTRAFMK